MPDAAPPRKKSMLYVQLIALVLLAFGIAVLPTLFSSAPAYARPWPQVLLTTAVIALVIFGLGRLAPGLNKVLTVLLVLGALLVPGIIIGLRVVTWGEQASARGEVRDALDAAMTPGHVEKLAAYVLEPSGPTHGLAPTPEDIARLHAYAVGLPPEELKRHRVAQRLLKGLEIRPTDSRSSQIPDESLEALSRLYVALQGRTGLDPETLPLDSRHRARIATRVAEVGLVGWRGEIKAEHPAYEVLGTFFYKESVKELFPQPLGPGEQVVSRTLGSLPLYMLLRNGALVQPEAGQAPVEDPYGFGVSRMQETKELLAVMKALHIDFTEEELRDEDLRAYLQRLQAL
ncbi:hypothetical protein [Archangium primigenium]|uniref:hypothetical protein n=1 Tax=[Archangium] primigenium TaxID=2792470 RepID=UPI00195DE50B|nr:hypothetical protein [Archangium primigenium]MBM7114815.1 hypothetical protein [Archangium primigenium]